MDVAWKILKSRESKNSKNYEQKIKSEKKTLTLKVFF